MRTALATVPVAGVLVAVAFGGDASTTSLSRGVEPNPAPTEVVVTRDDSGPKAGCRPRSLGERLIRFNAALNAADTDDLTTFWREKRGSLKQDRGPRARGTFVWFSIGKSSPTDITQFVAYRPGRALRYVRRHPLSLQLAEVVIGRGGNIIYTGAWILKDGSVGEVVGKGFVACRSPLIKVWSMSVRKHKPPLGGEYCPDPPGGVTPGVLVVCSVTPK